MLRIKVETIEDGDVADTAEITLVQMMDLDTTPRGYGVHIMEAGRGRFGFVKARDRERRPVGIAGAGALHDYGYLSLSRAHAATP